MATGAIAAAMSSALKCCILNSSGSIRLSTQNSANPYIDDASSRRSMTKLSKMMSMVDSTANKSSTGAKIQLNVVVDQVALAAYSGVRKKNICWYICLMT